MKLGKMIKDYRLRNDLSQREFARRAGLSNSLISLLEKEVNPQTGKEMTPDLDTFYGISRAMGITMQQLFEQLGDDATVQIVSFRADPDELPPYEPNSPEEFTDEEDREKNDDIRILFRGVGKMSSDEVKRVLDIIRAAFPNGDFKKEGS